LLNLARDRARTVVCSAHLTQLAIGLHAYMTDNRGYYPGDHWQTPGTRHTYISWAPRIRKYARSRDVFFCPSVDNAEARWNPPYDWTGEDVTWLGYEPGERPLMGNPPVDDGTKEYFSYGYNAWGVMQRTYPQLGLGGLIGEGVWAELRESRVAKPDDMIVIADSVADGVWDTWVTSEGPFPSSWPGNRHNACANVLFADSHVTPRRQKLLLTFDEFEKRRWNNDNQPHPESWGPPPVP
jgi:prepilin-type processing-associated H-X9-DG protein